MSHGAAGALAHRRAQCRCLRLELALDPRRLPEVPDSGDPHPRPQAAAASLHQALGDPHPPIRLQASPRRLRFLSLAPALIGRPAAVPRLAHVWRTSGARLAGCYWATTGWTWRVTTAASLRVATRRRTGVGAARAAHGAHTARTRTAHTRHTHGTHTHTPARHAHGTHAHGTHAHGTHEPTRAHGTRAHISTRHTRTHAHGTHAHGTHAHTRTRARHLYTRHAPLPATAVGSGAARRAARLPAVLLSRRSPRLPCTRAPATPRSDAALPQVSAAMSPCAWPGRTVDTPSSALQQQLAAHVAREMASQMGAQAGTPAAAPATNGCAPRFERSFTQ
eukprot:3857347-Prymnesium_polylepis.1